MCLRNVRGFFLFFGDFREEKEEVWKTSYFKNDISKFFRDEIDFKDLDWIGRKFLCLG